MRLRAYERLLHYITFLTASDETAETTPSTPGQRVLAEELGKEMQGLGFSDVYVDDHAYVYGFLPATAGCEDAPAIGLIAHLDTVGEVKPWPVHVQTIENYDGGVIPLGESGLTLDPAVFPHLNREKGRTILTTDGTTIFGADDKAGIAVILTMCEERIASGRPHGKICVCFTPDEEIGHGAALLDLERFGAQAAFTCDGGEPQDIEYETFHAAAARWAIHGVDTHPGSAKGVMVNASLIAMEIQAMLPPGEIPAETEGYEGFYHLCAMQGNVSEASLSYLIRDHDRASFEARKETMRGIEAAMQRKYGRNAVSLTLKDQYYNMAEIIRRHPRILAIARQAIGMAGLTPMSHAVRGGTDGAQLSFRGLPCPNLGTGGYGCHGPFEHVVVEEMDQVVQILHGIVDLYARETPED